jgi:multimeric flavodoxin WrbA
LKGKKLLFAAELDNIGYDLPLLSFLSFLQDKGNNSLLNSTAIILVHSKNEFSTKRFTQDIIFISNAIGCSFLGHPMVEATGSLMNFSTWKKTLNLSLEEICTEMCLRLGNRLIAYSDKIISKPKIVVLYSSPHKTSNTLDLWHLVSKHLPNYDIVELQIENGEVQDCKGCSYKLCMHYSRQNSCFYGGVMVENVLPTIEVSDVIVWLCPNYNDSLSANLSAVINRLTVLYNKISFSEKTIFSVVVSGNSGSDSIAKQIIGSLNINKGFKLPPYFSLMATANDPGAIYNVDNIELQAKCFAENFNNQFNCKSEH